MPGGGGGMPGGGGGRELIVVVVEDDVGCEECFWQRHPTVRTVEVLRIVCITIIMTNLSSRVRSNHCTLDVMSASWWRTIRCIDRLQIRSLRIGLRLYAIAELPI